MENILQNRSVDLQSGRYASVIIKQGDRDTRTVIFKLTDNGVPYTVPSGVSVYLSGTRADGSAIIQKLTINSEGNYPYTFTEYDTKIYGRSKCEIKLVEDASDKVLSSMTFVLVVEKSALSDQQIADAGDSRNLFKELVVALENAKKLQSIVDGLKDDVAGVESLSKEISDNEKVRQENETVRIQNEEGRKEAESQRNSNINSSLSSLNTAIDSANDLIEQVEQTDGTAQQTIKNLDDAIKNLNSSGTGITNLSLPRVSDTMPTDQNIGATWFVSDKDSKAQKISWENTENGTYAFVQSENKWTSNNKGVKSSTATSTWKITIDENVEYTIKYKVSSEASYDKFTLILDGTTIIANGISGIGSEIAYNASLSSGEHTLVATYVKDSSTDKNEDCACVILEPIVADESNYYVREIAIKRKDSAASDAYEHYPISTDSTYINRPDGKTLEESLSEMESAISNGSGSTDITVDEILLKTSMNPIANKPVAEKFDSIETSINSLENATSTNAGSITTLEEKAHTHVNNSLLNALSYSDGKLYYNGSPISASIAVDNSSIQFNSSNQLYAVNNHTHSNKSVLDLLSASGGQLYYNGSVVGSSSSGDYVLVSNSSNDIKTKIDNSGTYIRLNFNREYVGASGSLTLQERDSSLSHLSSSNASNGVSASISVSGYARGSYSWAGVRLRHGDYSVRMSGNSFFPDNSAIILGDSFSKWNVIYADTGTINTSDRNEKKDITYITDTYAKSIIMGLKPCSYKLIDNTSDRTHNGMIAQDVEELLTSLDVNSKDFAAFIKFEKEEKDDNGNTVYGYGLRYEEFIAPLIRFVQYQQARIDDLEGRIGALED